MFGMSAIKGATGDVAINSILKARQDGLFKI